MSETATLPKSSASCAYAPGIPRHSDESTTSRSVTPTISASSPLPHAGSPRQRQNTGRSETRSGSTTELGCCAAEPRSRSSITSESTSRDIPCSWKSFSSTRASIAVSPPRCGIRKIVRAGWRSSSPASVARACECQAGGHQTMCVIVLVRSSGIPSAASRARSRPSWRSMSATTLTGPSACARSGCRGGSGRRPPAAPRSRSRSSGSSAGHAASRRGSRRRASTAPRPRPRG